MVDGSNRPQARDIGGDLADDVARGTTVLAESILDRRYRLLSALTTRGPVTLWRGDDNVLTRPVAVRIVEHDQLSASDAGAADTDGDHEKAARRLLAAAINSGRLVHPGAASTYDATTTTTGSRRISYVVSEWVDGRTLRQLTADGPLRPEQAGAVVLAAARVIAAAHERGIHHGDLNPGDVIVSSHGTVKVIDLEIGGVLAEIERAIGAAGGHGGAVPDLDATQVVGAAVGPVDGATADLRALGGLLYAGLTGHWPLGGDRGLPTAPTSGGRLRTPRQVSPDVPRDLDAITMATLGDDRAGAPITTAAELVEELESINPVDAVLDTGLMSLGDAPPSTESMDVGGYDPNGYPSRSDYPSQDRYDNTAGYPGPGRDRRYDDRPEHPSSPRSNGYGRGGYDPRGGYDNSGYPSGPGGYPPPAQRYPSGPPDRQGAPLRRLLPWVAVVLIVAIVAVIAIVALHDDGGKGGGASPTPTSTGLTTPTASILKPSSIASFDPSGSDKAEKPGEVNNAIDGDAATAWHTEGYNNAQFGGLKPGVGLRLDFGQPITPTSVTVQISGGPVSLRILNGTSPGSDITSYTEILNRNDASGPVSLAMPSDLTPARYWLVWLTSLPMDPSDGKYRGAVAEIAFRP